MFLRVLKLDGVSRRFPLPLGPPLSFSTGLWHSEFCGQFPFWKGSPPHLKIPYLSRFPPPLLNHTYDDDGMMEMVVVIDVDDDDVRQGPKVHQADLE